MEQILTSAQINDFDDEAVLVAGDPSWPLGVLGLAASRLVEKFYRPVFLWSENGRGEIKGSCRSDGRVSVVDLMEESRALFTHFGGHKMSGCFGVDQDKIHILEQALSDSYKKLFIAHSNDVEDFEGLIKE